MTETETTPVETPSRCLSCCGCICKAFLAYIMITSIVGYIFLTPKNPIFKEAYEGNQNYVLTYIENGGDLAVRDRDNNTILFWAVKGGNVDIVNLLCKNGIDVNARNNINASALHISIFSNNTKVISSLVSHGCDVDSEDEDGNTPLHIACQYRRVESVKALLYNHANPNATNHDGDSPLHLVGKDCYDSDDCKAIVDTMKEYHADFKLENKKGIPAIEVILTADTIETLKQFSKPLNEKSHDEL